MWCFFPQNNNHIWRQTNKLFSYRCSFYLMISFLPRFLRPVELSLDPFTHTLAQCTHRFTVISISRAMWGFHVLLKDTDVWLGGDQLAEIQPPSTSDPQPRRQRITPTYCHIPTIRLSHSCNFSLHHSHLQHVNVLSYFKGNAFIKYCCMQSYTVKS